MPRSTSSVRLLAAFGPLAALVCATGPVGAQTRTPISPEDVVDLRTFAGGQVVAASPDGVFVAYVVTDEHDEWNVQEPRPTGFVAVKRLDSSEPARTLTSGLEHSSFPVWSPSGHQLAFYRETADGAQVMRWRADAPQAGASPVGEIFDERPWLPPQWLDETHVLFASARKRPPQARPRVGVVESTDARIPGDQFFVDERQAVLVVADTTTRRTTPLMPSPVVLRSYRLSPDRRMVLFVSPTAESLGVIGKERNETFVVPVAGGVAPRRVDTSGERLSWSPDGRLVFARDGALEVRGLEGGDARALASALPPGATEPGWAPDGKTFLTLVPDRSISDPEIVSAQPGMYSIAQPFYDVYLVADQGASVENLTADLASQMADPFWSADGASVFFRGIDNDTYDETIYRVIVGTRARSVIASGPEAFARLSPARDGVVGLVESATQPQDLWLMSAPERRVRLTTLNPEWEGRPLSAPRLFSFVNADGERLGALLSRPVGVPADRPVPVITWIYEKLTPSIHQFSARDQFFLSHGFALLKPNVKVIVGRTADSFEKCVVPAVNAVRAMGFTNGRFGLWGHSFGAYATSNLITRTNIFAAAVSGATPPELFRNWASGRDRDSRNIETGQARMGGSPFEYPERYLSQSAFFHLDQVSTPVLILHGEQDLTILFGEGEMMFYALRQLGKTATFVAYRNGDHSLSRHSRADAIDVNRRVLAWFEKYLEPQASVQSR